jgi:hypothetical protein
MDIVNLQFSNRAYALSVVCVASITALYKIGVWAIRTLSFLTCRPPGRAGGLLSLVNNPVELWPYGVFWPYLSDRRFLFSK